MLLWEIECRTPSPCTAVRQGRRGAGTRGGEQEFLPPYSPELQPAEHLWPLTDEGIANTLFAALDEPQEVPANRPELFSSATL